MMWYLQLLALRNDTVKDAQIADAAGDVESAEELWNSVESYQDEIEGHVNYQPQYDSLAFYLSTL